MILRLTDAEGDMVAIESAAIMAVSVGRLNGPHAEADPLAVTIVHTVAGPLIVSESPDVVVALWVDASRQGQPGQSLPVAALIGWQAQYVQVDPSGLLPGAPSWEHGPISKAVSDE